jgi:hypothetical protein
MMILWIRIAINEEKSFETTLNEYLSNYPAWLRKPAHTIALKLVLGGIAIICFVFAIKYTHKNLIRNLLYFLIILSGILVFWNLFSLM